MRIRPSHAVAVPTVVAVLALAGCSDDGGSAARPASSSTSSSSSSSSGGTSSSPSQAPSQPAAAAAGGTTRAPITAAAGYACAGDLPRDEQLFMTLDLPGRPRADVRLTGVDLVDARGSRIVDAWAAPGRGRHGGRLSVGRFAGRRSDPHWAHREPLAGARFDAGAPIALLLRIEPTSSALTRHPAFRDLKLHYTSAGTDFAVRLGSGARFGHGDCHG